MFCLRLYLACDSWSLLVATRMINGRFRTRYFIFRKVWMARHFTEFFFYEEGGIFCTLVWLAACCDNCIDRCRRSKQAWGGAKTGKVSPFFWSDYDPWTSWAALGGWISKMLSVHRCSLTMSMNCPFWESQFKPYMVQKVVTAKLSLPVKVSAYDVLKQHRTWEAQSGRRTQTHVQALSQEKV